MNKILSGSTVNYGAILPALSKTSDGAMFYLTDTYTDPAGSPTNTSTKAIIRGAGLYTYVFAKDANSTLIGNQAGYSWVTVANMENFVKKLGDEMSGLLLMTGQIWSGVLQIKNKTPSLRLTNTANIADNQELRIVYDTVSSTKAGLFSIQRRRNEDPTNATENLKWLGDFLSIDTNGTIKSFGNTIWHTGNDGKGSSLDAGKLGGEMPAYYLDSANQTGTLPVTRGGTGATSFKTGGVLFGSTSTVVSSTAAGIAGQVLISNGVNAPAWANATSLAAGNAGSLTTARKIELTTGVTGSALFNGANDIQIKATVASTPWKTLENITDFGKTILKVANFPFTNCELSARPSYFYTYTVAENLTLRDIKPLEFPAQSLTGFDFYSSDNQALSTFDGTKNFKVGITIRGENPQAMQLAAHWNYAEETPYGGLFYRVNDDNVTPSEWGKWSQVVDAEYLKKYDQEIKSSKPIRANLFKAWSGDSKHGSMTIVGSGDWGDGTHGYGGYLEFRAQYPNVPALDTSVGIRQGYIGNGSYPYAEPIAHDQGRIEYVAGQHYFTGLLWGGGQVHSQRVVARNEPQYKFTTTDGKLLEWETTGYVALTAGAPDRTGTINFYSSYADKDVGIRRAGYIGNGHTVHSAPLTGTATTAAALATDLGSLDYVAGLHNFYGDLHFNQPTSVPAELRKTVVTIKSATGDISTIGNLTVGTNAKISGSAEIIGDLKVTGKITGSFSMDDVKVSETNMNANSVNTTAIKDKSVTAAKLADESVAARQMGINDLGNLCWNGKGDSLDGWLPSIAGSIQVSQTTIVPKYAPVDGVYDPVTGEASTSVTLLASAAKSFAFKTRDNWFGPIFNVKPGEKYFFQMDTYTAAASVYSFSIGLQFWDSNGNMPMGGGWFPAATRAAGKNGTVTISGELEIPVWAARAKIWFGSSGPHGVIYTAASQIHYATNIIVRHATFSANSINPRALVSIGDTTNMFTDYDFVEDYWTKTSTSTVDGIKYTMWNAITEPAIPSAFNTPRVLRFSGEAYRTRPDIGGVLGTTYAAAVSQPTSALSRVYAGDELSLSYTCHSDGIATGNMVVLVQWYDSKKVLLTSGMNSPYVTCKLPTTSPTRTSGSFTVPANACYASVYIVRRTNVNGEFTQGWVDIGDIRLIQKLDAAMVSDVVQTNGNLLMNTDTPNNEPYVGRGWSFSDGGFPENVADDMSTIGQNVSAFHPTQITAANWSPPKSDPFGIMQNGASAYPSTYTNFISSTFPVLAGERYEFSVYIQTLKAGGSVHIQFVDASNNSVGSASSSVLVETTAGEVNAQKLGLWTRLGGFAVAPSNALSARIYLRKSNTDAGQSWSWALFLYPYIGRANRTQTMLSAYSPGKPFVPSGGVISANNMITSSNVTSIISEGVIGDRQLANDINLSTLNVTGTATAGSFNSAGTATLHDIQITGRGITGTMGGNDEWGIFTNGAKDAGYLEIYTGDNGTEPIYFRQYGFNAAGSRVIVNTATILDGSGNTSFPNTVNVRALSATGAASVGSLSSSGAVSGNTLSATGNVSGNTLSISGAASVDTLTVDGKLGVHGAMAGSDEWGIRAGGASDNGYLEIYTTDNGNEPIYVRQYTNGAPTRAAVLLNAAGNTSFPGNIDSVSVSVSGTATVGALVSNGDVTAFSTSDRSIKSNIEVIQNALNKIDAISGVTFNRTDKEDEPREAGVIAQEVQAVLPEVVRVQGSGLLGVDYGKLVSLLIQGIKEQQVQIDALKEDIRILKGGV